MSEDSGVTAPGFDTEDRALTDRMRQFLGHIEDMGDGERVYMLGRLTGALERRLNPPAAALMRAGRTLSQVPESLCTLYRVRGETWEDHECVGIVKSPEIAAAVCEAVNARGVPLPSGEVGR